jgi:hypothetical protein
MSDLALAGAVGAILAAGAWVTAAALEAARSGWRRPVTALLAMLLTALALAALVLGTGEEPTCQPEPEQTLDIVPVSLEQWRHP